MSKENEPKVEPQVEKDPWKETVKIKLPRVKGKEECAHVGVNGRFFQIQRGVSVDVPMPVYEVLQNSEDMESKAAEFEAEAAAKAQAMVKNT